MAGGPSQSDRLDLSGAWQGLYSYPVKQPSVPFTATLDEALGWLTGRTEETGSIGDARGLTISATLQGRRTGRSVTFLKTYDGAYRGYDSVRYEGAVNEEGTEIDGRWSIAGVWSGSFLMIRSGSAGFALTRETAEQV